MAGFTYHHRISCVIGEINGTGLLGVRTDSLPSNFTPIFLSQLLNKNASHVSLVSGCNDDLHCKFDVLATGDKNIGQNTNAILETFQDANGTLSK